MDAVTITLKLTPADFSLLRECLADAAIYTQGVIEESREISRLTGTSVAERKANATVRFESRVRLSEINTLERKLS